MGYDVVIRGGTVVDGSGLAPYRADVAVVGDRIAAIGRVRERGDREVDAEGHVVTPGFIDGHTHMDAQLFWDELGTNSCWHGVTTVLMGNCGFTLAPSSAEQRGMVVRNLERAEDISGEAMEAGIEWTWETFAEYLDAVDRVPKGINYAAQIGHSALRTWAMGERAFEQEANADDLLLMEREVRDALRAGAFGFTTSRSPNHQTSDNRPVASRLASWDEVRHLVGVLGDLGTGLFELAQEPQTGSSDPEVRDEVYGRMRALAVESGVPITFGVTPVRPYADHALEFIDDTAARGGRAFGLTHSRGIAVVLSFKTRLPFDRVDEWREIRGLPLDEQDRLLRDPTVRERLVKSARAMPRPPRYDGLHVWCNPVPPNPTVAEVAAARGVDPVEAMIDLALETGFDQCFVQPLAPYRDDDVVSVMKHPRTVMTFSDSGAHVSQIADFSIQTHLLAYWVRERQAFTLEEAVRMLTLAPAVAFGFPDRGLLREGLAADINVFDPETIAPTLPIVEHDLPRGGARLTQRATGLRATIVGGQVVTRDGAHTGALPGRLLRGPLASRR